MRVLVLSSVFPNPRQPTLGVFIHERVRRMAARCEVTVVAPVPWFPLNGLIRPQWTGIPPIEDQAGFLVHHPRFFCVPRYAKWLDGFLYAASLVPHLARLRRSFPFDVIDAHFAYPDGVGAALLGRIFRRPVVITLRGTIARLSSLRSHRFQIRAAMHGASRIFAVSHSLGTVAMSLGIPAGKIRVIPNGVDTTLFRPGRKGAARKSLGLPDNCAILLSVGSLSLRKGHQRVLEALPGLAARWPDILYVVVGGPGPEGDTGPHLRTLAASLGLQDHLWLAGPQPHGDIPHWLAAADVFCLATSNEGRANAILEALACGLPVVTTRVGGSPEVIRDGSDGFLVDLGDREHLTRALADALVGRWDHESIAARAQARTWDDVATAVVSEFGQLVPGSTISDPDTPSTLARRRA